MQVIVILRVEELQDGTFKPGFELIEPHGNGETITPYLVDLFCENREEAEEQSKRHAAQEIIEQYGPDAKMFIKVEN